MNKNIIFSIIAVCFCFAAFAKAPEKDIPGKIPRVDTEYARAGWLLDDRAVLYSRTAV